MKITADNRGRIALSKLNRSFRSSTEFYIGGAGTEWDASFDKGYITLRPWREEEPEPAPEWVKVGNLTPDHIGQVIGIDWDSIPQGGLPTITYGASNPGAYGTLEWYQTGMMGHDIKSVKLAGVDPYVFDNYGMFYVKNVC